MRPPGDAGGSRGRLQTGSRTFEEEEEIRIALQQLFDVRVEYGPIDDIPEDGQDRQKDQTF